MVGFQIFGQIELVCLISEIQSMKFLEFGSGDSFCAQHRESALALREMASTERYGWDLVHLVQEI